MTTPVRVRFAPSPSGLLHVGNARTALFNWLFARRRGGVLILRLEDTDAVRSAQEAERGVYASLRWLKLFWDEGPVRCGDLGAPGPGDHGPYRQSERGEIYRRRLSELRAAGRVYPCFCAAEELEAERRRRARAGLSPAYSGQCALLSEARARELMGSGRHPAWRFRVGSGVVGWRDEVRGELWWDRGQIGDFIVARADATATYNLAATVDDHLMAITHVIRGDDHLANTPKQILLHRALGWDPPRFAHLPLIVGPDRKPLAKRHGAASLDDLYRQGFLPEAVVNHLALLGWSPPSGRELLGPDELAEEFELARVRKSPSVFDLAKLRWINGKKLRELDPPGLAAACAPYLAHDGAPVAALGEKRLTAALASVQTRLRALGEAGPALSIYWSPVDPAAAARLLDRAAAPKVLAAAVAALGGREALDRAEAARLLLGVGSSLGLSGRELFLPLRIAITGLASGPDLDAVVVALGPVETARRLRLCLERLEAMEGSKK